MRVIVLLFFVAAAALLPAPGSADEREPRSLLIGAIALVNKSALETDPEKRLTMLKNALHAMHEITSQYPESAIAKQIQSSGIEVLDREPITFYSLEHLIEVSQIEVTFSGCFDNPRAGCLFDAAIRTARISRENYPLVAIVEMLADTGDVGGAVELARSIGSSKQQAQALISIGESILEGSAHAFLPMILVESARVAGRISDLDDRARALSETASLQFRAAELDDARSTMEAVLDLHEKLSSWEKGNVLWNLAEGQLSAGHVSEARQTISRASSWWAERLRVEIVERALELGDTEAANEEAGAVKGDYAISSLLKAMLANNQVERGVALLPKITEPSARSRALVAAAPAMASAGRGEKARSFLFQALEAAREIDEYTGKVSSLTRVAAAWRDIGELDQSTAIIEEALTFADTLEDPNYSYALSNIASTQAKFGQIPAAIKTIERAPAGVNHFSAYKQIVAVVLQRNQPARALELARTYSNVADRAILIAMIARYNSTQ